MKRRRVMLGDYVLIDNSCQLGRVVAFAQRRSARYGIQHYNQGTAETEVTYFDRTSFSLLTEAEAVALRLRGSLANLYL